MKRTALAMTLLVSLRCIPLLYWFWFAVAQAGTVVEHGRFHLVCKFASGTTMHYYFGGRFDGYSGFNPTAQDQLNVGQSAQTIDGMGFQSARFKIKKPDTISVSPETAEEARGFYRSISIQSQAHRAFPLPDGDQEVPFRVVLFVVERCRLIPLTNTCEFETVTTVWGDCR